MTQEPVKKGPEDITSTALLQLTEIKKENDKLIGFTIDRLQELLAQDIEIQEAIKNIQPCLSPEKK